MFSAQINNVLRAFLRTDSIAFQTPNGVEAIVLAADAGLCRIVPYKGHTVSLVDRNWNVTLGVVLTEFGNRHLKTLR